MATRPVHTIPRSKQRQYPIAVWLSGLLIGLLGVSLALYFFWLRPNPELLDVIGVKTEHCLCRVNEIKYLPATKGKADRAVQVEVDIAGYDVEFQTHAHLHQNEDVQVTYRIGRSGDVYIDDIEPEGKAKL